MRLLVHACASCSRVNHHSDGMEWFASMLTSAPRSLDSASWSVRNAALQLVGAVVSRVVGQVGKSREKRDNCFEQIYFPLIQV